ncbi:46015_t:CDS:2 [Gigaspora margarita]|uniref:46015_t:CDS:1 n=1 Tax=Gigaspora margarita TaxID=4874 RepID=A0ABN7V2E6_GIGMA|nr:46015_t:CDS:2 [Gigaspora margarita]
MRSIRVNFHFYDPETVGGKYKWTALMGLHNQIIEKLWQDFFSKYKLIHSKNDLADTVIDKFEIDIQNWVSTFCQPTLKTAT